MSEARRSGPADVLRNLALSLERLATQGAAGGVVHGVADGLRGELPDEVEAQLRRLLHDALTVLGRVAQRAALHEAPHAAEAVHDLSAAAMRGALEELEREWADGGMPLHDFMERMNMLLEDVSHYARSRAHVLQSPEGLAGNAVKGAMGQVREELPALAQSLRELSPVVAELAEHVGRGLVHGVHGRLHEDPVGLSGLLERAGQGLVHGLAAGMREELKEAQRLGALGPDALSAGALGAHVEHLAESTAEAALRGARRGLTAPGAGEAVRITSRELTRGVLEALSSLRRPLAAAGAAAGALLTVAFVARLRHA